MEFRFNKVFLLILLFVFVNIAKAQRIDRELSSETTILLKTVINDKSCDFKVIIDGDPVGVVKAGETLAINRECSKYVKVESSSGTKDLWRSGDTAAEWKKKHNVETIQAAPVEEHKNEVIPPHEEPQAPNKPVITRRMVDKTTVISSFCEVLEKDSIYSESYLNSLKAEISRHIGVLDYVSDKDHKDKYVNEQRLNAFVLDKENQISLAEERLEYFITEFINSKYSNSEIIDKNECVNEMTQILQERINERRDALKELHNAIEDDTIALVVNKFVSGESIIVNIAVGLIVLLIIVLLIRKIARKNKKGKNTIEHKQVSDGKADIVVRRKTTSILKKQSLEDVNNNDAYLAINTIDFCKDSSVRRIYIKNTCVKEIYNMYAEDLRNPENPKEDGCMVLGRWVHDNDNDEYYVSLEEIVKPGDDAVFKEYELNFGGKIKLKVAEKLRKLRRETNLQYDMTCWVHSHPGLGVFFSNADSGVHMQLKHPTHPNFLIAIVVDILTPNQEMGIFTFKHDQTINSKADLSRMYSLEELYKWAIESTRSAFKPEDYYNIIQSAQCHEDNLSEIDMSNGAIIDICQLGTELQTGLLLWVHGYACLNSGKQVYIVNSISKLHKIPDNELLGCMVVGTHCSIPTIRKVVSDNIQNLNFILFYSISDGILTSIPIINKQISVDERYFGEEKLENLKIWTRRKR